NGPVVGLLQPVEVDVEEEPRRRPEQVQLASDEHPVGTQVNVLAPLEDASHQLADVRVDQRLSAADSHDRRPRLIDRIETLLNSEFLLDGALVLTNPAAPRTRE